MRNWREDYCGGCFHFRTILTTWGLLKLGDSFCCCSCGVKEGCSQLLNVIKWKLIFCLQSEIYKNSTDGEEFKHKLSVVPRKGRPLLWRKGMVNILYHSYILFFHWLSLKSPFTFSFIWMTGSQSLPVNFLFKQFSYNTLEHISTHRSSLFPYHPTSCSFFFSKIRQNTTAS